MQGERIVLDGLWRCLCPSIDAATLTATLQRPVIQPRRLPVIQRRNAATRAYSGLPDALEQRMSRPQAQPVSSEGTPIEKCYSPRWKPPTISSSKYAHDSHSSWVYRMWKRHRELPISFFDQHSAPYEALDGLRTETIVEGLRELILAESQYHGICNIVRYLVTRRNRKPDVFLYECLIKANIDLHHGSARVVANILEEMDSRGILPTPAIFHSVLDVLAVHPDYVLRNRIAGQMKAAWNPPTFDGLVSITVGLFRDGQYEMALEKLEELHQTGIAVPFWLYDIFIFGLGERGAHTETLMVMQHRIKDPDAPIPHNLWHFLLGTFSRDAHYEGIKYIWNRVVMLGKLVPCDGVAINILNAASREGDISMAMQVVKYLSNRGVKLGMHHFEALLEIQARDGDLQKAFSTMCLMVKAGLQPDRSSTRSIWLHLHSSPEQTEQALAILHDLKKNHEVPIAAFNTVLEAVLVHRDFKAGLDLYRTVHQVCSAGPNLETFGLLMGRCTLQRSMRFLMAEMEQFSVEPEEEIYDRAIFISTLGSKYESAFRYLQKMRSSKTDEGSNDWWISRKTALSLLRRAILAEDGRTQELIAECKNREVVKDSDIQILVNAAQQRRQASEKLIAPASTDGVAHSSLPELGVARPTTQVAASAA